MASKVRFDRGSIQSAVDAAIRLQSASTLYVFATHHGFTIDRQKPPFGQRYIEVSPDGTIKSVLAD